MIYIRRGTGNYGLYCDPRKLLNFLEHCNISVITEKQSYMFFFPPVEKAVWNGYCDLRICSFAKLWWCTFKKNIVKLHDVSWDDLKESRITKQNVKSFRSFCCSIPDHTRTACFLLIKKKRIPLVFIIQSISWSPLNKSKYITTIIIWLDSYNNSKI